MTTPCETVNEWFVAHGRGDLDAARSLVADDLVVTVTGRPEISGEFRGFDAFMRWYADRTHPTR